MKIVAVKKETRGDAVKNSSNNSNSVKNNSSSMKAPSSSSNGSLTLPSFLPSPSVLVSAKSVYEASKRAKTAALPKTASSSKPAIKKAKTKAKSKAAQKKSLKIAVTRNTIQPKESTKAVADEKPIPISVPEKELNVENLTPFTHVSVAKLLHSEDSSGSDIDLEVEEDDSDPVITIEAPEPNKEVIYQTLDAFDFIISTTSTAALAFIPFQTCFYFKGRLNVTVLSGVAEIQGYIMEESTEKTYQAFSPRGYSLQCIRSIGRASKSGPSPSSVQSLLKKNGLDCEVNTLKKKSATNTVLLLQSLNSPMVDYLSRIWPSNIMRREECIPPGWEEESRNRFSQLCTRLDASIILRGAVFSARFYQQPDAWMDYTQQLISQAEEKKEPVRLMLCGGKGVGKSTLLRYIVNRLMKRFGSVLVVDFDPGQPELFPAGCVSASLVSEPLLGPNVTHFQQPQHSYFVGDADITICPDRYLRSCQQLLNDCRMDPVLSSAPMIVNTMGFTTGVGLDVTLDLIRLTQPLQVFHL